MDIEALKFPVGRFVEPEDFHQEMIEKYTASIRHFPDLLEAKLKQLEPHQLNETYREGSWTIRQIVHHLADSHMNAFIRFKLALTEEQPVIKPYLQDAFVAMSDEKDFDILPSLAIIRGVHERWTRVIESMTALDYERTYIHPEYGKVYPLKLVLAQYDWHCRTHLGHIQIVIDRAK
ncbi:MAG: YfiT family bacillithiol transferase [Bacteroidia bacterium]